ncbi:MAG: fibronectin type III domain-containing protein [Gemmatimonadaceae bacterium]
MMSFLLRRRAPWFALTASVVMVACGDDDPTEPVTPIPPANVQVTTLTSTSARVTFAAVSGASSYVIERAAGASGGTFTVLDTITAPPFDDTGLTPQTTYRYRVASLSGSLRSGYSPEAPVTLGATPVVTLTGDITASRTLDRDTIYKVSGFVKVTNGQTLTIESGTRIVGDQATAGSALFILRGAKIIADGTASAPIVFTSEKAAGQRGRGDWGGLIVVGSGRINRSGQVILEGSNANVPNGGAPGIDYGGGTASGDTVSSGTLRYVRVEFAGYAVAAAQELNSFTLAAVGSNTTVEYLQSVMGLDDSFEWFGGAVNGRYLVSYESGDDHFDAAEGYRGKNQFLIAFQSLQGDPAGSDPQGFEVDGCAGGGCTAPAGGVAESSEPYNMPVFANFTVVGTGNVGLSGSSGGVGMVLRRGTGGTYINGVVARWPRRGISVRDSTTFNREATDSLLVSNVLLAENAGGHFDADSVKARLGAAGFEESANTTASLFTAFPTTTDQNTTGASFDWTPAAGSPAATGGMNAFTGVIQARAGTFIQPTAYRGAADPAGPKWWTGWTVYYRN